MHILFTGGGTAGHVKPAISLIRALKEEVTLSYIGNDQYVEKKLIEKEGVPFYSIRSQGFEGNKFRFVKENTMGVFKAIKLLRKLKPSLVFATGGFVTAPVLLAAQILAIPFVIHEQNAKMGKVNALFWTRAKRIYTTFPLRINKECLVGNPVTVKGEAKSGNEVVFMGGSGGSVFLNDLALSFSEKYPSIQTVLLCGKKQHEKVIERYEALGSPKNVTIIDYIDDIESIYDRAKLLVARSGAGVIFEMIEKNIPTVLIPLPDSAGNHQHGNAAYMDKQSLAILIEQKEGKEYIENAIETLIKEKETCDKIRKIIKNERNKEKAEIKIIRDLKQNVF